MYASVQTLIDCWPSLPADPSLHATLRLNAPLESTEQKASISALLRERRDHLRELSAEITLLADALSRLKRQRKAVDEEARVCQMAIKSPIRALPADVMCDILSLAVVRAPWDPPQDLEISSPTVRSLLGLTQVCRGWRQAMHSLPLLWRELPLSWDLVENDVDARQSRQWLARARDLPLSMAIWEPKLPESEQSESSYLDERSEESEEDEDEESEEDEDEESEEAEDEEDTESDVAGMGIILGCRVAFPTYRIRDLRLVGNADNILPHICLLPRDSFPLLERLHLKLHEVGNWRGMTPSIVAFAESTRLWHLRLEGHIPEFFYENLHRRSVTDVHLGLCEHVLRRVAFLGQCPHLERLDIESQEFYPITRSDLDFDAVELGRLKSLTMRGLRCVYLPEKLTTPLLRSFSWYEVTHAFGPHVSAFLKRAPRVSSFALDGIFYQMEPADYPSLLRCLPRVKTLAFTRIDIAIYGLFEALTIRSGEEVLAPDLQEIILDRVTVGRHGPTLDCSVRMVHSRWRSPHRRIRRVVYRDTPNDSVLPDMLKELSDEGLEVEL
ncbi:hypothetical protein K523DRAFT_412258 [Schizophyllum commune Tattone D]|nr:hypothetical protein K523DRAFT_412258 [Schizophyllum commune Tattone D]